MKKIESELYTMFAAQPVEKTLPPALIEAAEKNAKKRKRHWRALAASAVSFVLVLVISLYAGLVVFAPANNKGEEQGPQYERVGYDASLSYGLAPAEWEYALKSSDRGLLFSLAEAPIPDFLFEAAMEGGEVWYFYRGNELVLSRWQTGTVFAAVSSVPVTGGGEFLTGEKIWLAGVEVIENDGKFYFSHLSYDWYFDGEGLQGELENFLKEGNV